MPLLLTVDIRRGQRNQSELVVRTVQSGGAVAEDILDAGGFDLPRSILFGLNMHRALLGSHILGYQMLRTPVLVLLARERKIATLNLRSEA